MDGWINESIHRWMDWSNERKMRREGIQGTSNKKRERGVGAVGGEWRKMRGKAVKEHYSQNSCRCVIYLIDGAQSILVFPVNLLGDWKISSVWNCIPHTYRGVEGMVGEVKSVSWGGARTKGEVHKRKLTKSMFFHSDFLTSPTSSLTPLFLRLENSRCKLMK